MRILKGLRTRTRPNISAEGLHFIELEYLRLISTVHQMNMYMIVSMPSILYLHVCFICLIQSDVQCVQCKTVSGQQRPSGPPDVRLSLRLHLLPALHVYHDPGTAQRLYRLCDCHVPRGWD